MCFASGDRVQCYGRSMSETYYEERVCISDTCRGETTVHKVVEMRSGGDRVIASRATCEVCGFAFGDVTPDRDKPSQ